MARDDVLRAARRDKAFRALRASARDLFCELVVIGPVNNAGVLPLNPAKWAAGTDADTASVVEDLAVLAAAGFVIVDAENFEVMIRGFIRDSGAHRHPNRLRGALNAARLVDSPKLRQYLALELHKLGDPAASEVSEILLPRSDPDPNAIGSGSDRNPSDNIPDANSERTPDDSSEVP